jgi:hypothetical protein
MKRPASREPLASTSTGATGNGAHGGSDRTSRFFSRLDLHLRTLSDDSARRALLARQQAGWEHRYERFLATAGASEPISDPANPPQAADFLATITGLAARRGVLEGDRMSNDYIADRRTRALLSLLVAADQCCPTIIGQAHLLYRICRDPRSHFTLPETFRELKNAAEELGRAIGAAEATIRLQQPATE